LARPEWRHHSADDAAMPAIFQRAHGAVAGV